NQLILNLNSFIQSPKTNIKINAKKDENVFAQWSIHIANFKNIIPALHGSLSSAGQLEGSVSNPHTVGNFIARSFSFNDMKAHTISGKWNIDFNNKQLSSLT